MQIYNLSLALSVYSSDFDKLNHLILTVIKNIPNFTHQHLINSRFLFTLYMTFEMYLTCVHVCKHNTMMIETLKTLVHKINKY